MWIKIKIPTPMPFKTLRNHFMTFKVQTSGKETASTKWNRCWPFNPYKNETSRDPAWQTLEKCLCVWVGALMCSLFNTHLSCCCTGAKQSVTSSFSPAAEERSYMTDYESTDRGWNLAWQRSVVSTPWKTLWSQINKCTQKSPLVITSIARIYDITIQTKDQYVSRHWEKVIREMHYVPVRMLNMSLCCVKALDLLTLKE